jgi:hemolysin activation/secretion protein
MSDVMWGDTPFYELDHAGAFPNDANIGGAKATRGIPEGRYRGQTKLLGQLELRSWIIGHMLGNTHVRAGLEAFLDTGRVWAVTGQKNPDLDGTGLGIKAGTGIGLRLGWGEYGVVRVDFAWSRDGDPNQPFGIYMDVDNTF